MALIVNAVMSPMLTTGALLASTVSVPDRPPLLANVTGDTNVGGLPNRNGCRWHVLNQTVA